MTNNLKGLLLLFKLKGIKKEHNEKIILNIVIATKNTLS